MFKKIFILFITGILLFLVSCSVVDSNATLLADPIEIKFNYNFSKEESYINFLDKLDKFSSKISYEYYDYYDIEDDKNLSISPLSIYMALSLAAECSSGETRTELLNALGITYEEVRNFTKPLLENLIREIYLTQDNGSKKLISKLDLTNSIWIQKDLNVKDDCINSLANNYYCYPYKTDFYKNNSMANKAIKEFINKRTNGLINQNFNLKNETLIALINTLYLKDIWSDTDDLLYTSNKYDFMNSNGSINHINLLQGLYYSGCIYEESDFTHFYTQTSRGYKLKFIVPKDNKTVEDIFTSGNINKVNNIKYKNKDDIKKETYFTRCFFPEFKASCDNDIIDLMANRFEVYELFKSSCNFSNITDLSFNFDRIVDGIYCSTIIHKTELDVNKEGIEGAAVTIIAANESTSIPGNDYKNVYYDYIIDRSFGYVLTDVNDIVLFSGVVNKC